MIHKQSTDIMDTLRRIKNINFWCLIPGMTPAEVYLLSAICDEHGEKKKVSDLYEACDMQPTAVSRLMNTLEEKGLIVRNTRKDNRRIIDVDATALGKKANQENRDIIQAYWAQVLGNIPEEDVEAMLRVLNEVKASMENVLAEQLRGRKEDHH